MSDVIIPVERDDNDKDNPELHNAIEQDDKSKSEPHNATKRDDKTKPEPHNITKQDGKSKPHNGNPITNVEVSPNGNCLVTYSEKDRSIVVWNINDIDEGRLKSG